MEDVKYSLPVKQVQDLITTTRVGRGPGNADRAGVLDKIQAAAKAAQRDARVIDISLSRSDLRAVKMGALAAWDDLSTEGALVVRNACRAIRIWSKGVEPLLPKSPEPDKDKIEDLLDEDGEITLDPEE